MRSPGPSFDLRAALTDEVRAAAAAFDAAPDDAKSVHRCRVHLKRARALARVGSTCAPGLAAVFEDSARAAMQALAQERNLAALAETAREAAAKARKRERAALKLVAEQLDTERQAVGPASPAITRGAVRDLLALAQVWPEASTRQLIKGAARIVRRARRACRRGRGASAVERRHEWRKREKDRLYAAQLMRALFPAPRRRKDGEALGDALGRERDTLLLIERLDLIAANDDVTTKRARRALKRRAHRLAARADRIGARLHRAGA